MLSPRDLPRLLDPAVVWHMISSVSAPAVAITLRCDSCIAVHLAAAGKPGATREEIAEALGVGISVNAGAALVYSARTLDAFDATA